MLEWKLKNFRVGGRGSAVRAVSGKRFRLGRCGQLVFVESAGGLDG